VEPVEDTFHLGIRAVPGGGFGVGGGEGVEVQRGPGDLVDQERLEGIGGLEGGAEVVEGDVGEGGGHGWPRAKRGRWGKLFGLKHRIEADGL
jgi:hypothetical protein